MAGTADVPFIHNPHSPDVFADAAAGWFSFNGVMRITFESARVNHVASPGPVERVVVGRLVMPVAAAGAMARGLLQFIEQQKAGVELAQGNVTVQ